jgi:hypothetical protein
MKVEESNPAQTFVPNQNEIEIREVEGSSVNSVG